MALRYMLTKDESTFGPYHASQIQALWKSGQVTDLDFIAVEGSDKWIQVGQWKAEIARKDSTSEFTRKLVIFTVLGCFFIMAMIGAHNSREQEKIGPPVYNSSLDGSVRQVKQWVRQNIADKDAEVRKWGKVYKDPDDGTYWCEAAIAGKNAFGGPVVNRYTFTFDKRGNILSAKRNEEK